MQIVIEIDKKHYTDIKESEHCGNYSVLYALDAIRNGKPLPKNHGRLIDADELKKHKYHDYETRENAIAVAQIDWAETIIEAEEG